MSTIDLNHKKVLIVRPDNIGDLVCTTPLMHQLRDTFPGIHLDVFVNSYNAPVLQGQPDIDGYYYYTKAKHRGKRSLLSVYWHRFKTMMKLRHTHYDYAILAGVGFQWKGLRFARQLGIKNIVGYCPDNHPKCNQLAISIPFDPQAKPDHEVEMVSALLKPFGITGKPGPLSISPDATAVAKMQHLLQEHGHDDTPIIGIHISSRKAENRWPEAYFIELMQSLWAKHHHPFMLFWSPGDENNAFHPGDDQKAQRIIEALPEVTVIPCHTTTLPELVAGMSLCDSMICADGGAMHVAAALVNTMVVIFGKTNPTQWHPWGVKHLLLKSDDNNAATITVEQAINSFEQLQS